MKLPSVNSIIEGVSRAAGTATLIGGSLIVGGIGSRMARSVTIEERNENLTTLVTGTLLLVTGFMLPQLSRATLAASLFLMIESKPLAKGALRAEQIARGVAVILSTTPVKTLCEAAMTAMGIASIGALIGQWETYSSEIGREQNLLTTELTAAAITLPVGALIGTAIAVKKVVTKMTPLTDKVKILLTDHSIPVTGTICAAIGWMTSPWEALSLSITGLLFAKFAPQTFSAVKEKLADTLSAEPQPSPFGTKTIVALSAVAGGGAALLSAHEENRETFNTTLEGVFIGGVLGTVAAIAKKVIKFHGEK